MRHTGLFSCRTASKRHRNKAEPYMIWTLGYDGADRTGLGSVLNSIQLPIWHLMLNCIRPKEQYRRRSVTLLQTSTLLAAAIRFPTIKPLTHAGCCWPSPKLYRALQSNHQPCKQCTLWAGCTKRSKCRRQLFASTLTSLPPSCQVLLSGASGKSHPVMKVVKYHCAWITARSISHQLLMQSSPPK